MATCSAGCDDQGAVRRHLLIDELAKIGVEGTERYLGAGNTAIEVPSDVPGVTWSLTNLFDGQPNDWMVYLEVEGGTLCSHVLAPSVAPLYRVARRFHRACLMTGHPLAEHDGPMTPAEQAAWQRRQAEHDQKFDALLPSL